MSPVPSSSLFHPFLRASAFVAWLAVGLAACGGGQSTGLNADAIAEAAGRSVGSVVNISSTRIVRQQGGGGRGAFLGGGPSAREEQSLGSGVIMSESGVVLTNHHVVQDATEITVTLHDGRSLDAKLLGSDRESDVAVLQLQGDVGSLTAIEVANSNDLAVGQIVLAIGNPFGIGQTVTMGIVSALGRAGMGINQYENFVQTDAAINPGNSGGALVDLDGRLVAINTAIATRTGSYSGVGFAIPSNMALTLMQRLLTDGKIVRGWLGVRVTELNPKLAQALSLDTVQGVLVSAVVEGSPAHRVGVLPEDLVLRFNGESITSPQQLHNLIATSGANVTFSIELLRRGERITLQGELGSGPNEPIPDTT